MTRIKKVSSILLAFAIIFSGLPALAGSFEADAATAYWKNVKVSATAYTKNTITWKTLTKAQQKKIVGIAVFRGTTTKNMKVLARTKKGNAKYIDAKAKTGTKYCYRLKTYTTKKVNQKQYYNKSTKKWVAKKPAAKYWGKCPSGKYKGKKTRTVKVTQYKYANASPVKWITTKKKPANTKTTNDVFNVYMDNGTWDLEDGDTISISAESTNSITWSSSNTAIATVTKNSSSQGAKVKFLKAGTVTITASATVNGSTKTKKATYTITDSRPSTGGGGSTGTGTTWRDKAKNWADENIIGQHTDGYIVCKARRGVDAIHAMYPNYYMSCGMAAEIIDEICKYKGVTSKSRSCARDDDYGVIYTGGDSHINNLVKINGTWYVVDAVSGFYYYDNINNHIIGGSFTLEEILSFNMTDAEINELGLR